MILFYLLIWILPLVNHPLWGSQIGPLTVFEYIGLYCLIYSIVRMFSRGKVPPVFSAWVTRLFLILYAFAFFSVVIHEGLGSVFANPSFTIYTSSLFLFVLAVSLVDTLERLRWTVLAVIGSYAWASLYVIREWQKGSGMSSGYRPGWIVGDSNYFATAAIVAIILAFAFMQGDRARWEKLYCLGCLVVTLIGVTLCASRGGFLGLVVAFLLAVWRAKHRVRNLALFGILILPLSVLLPVSPLHRFLHPSFSETGSEQYHEEAWEAGLHMIEAHPFIGVGLGQFKPMMPQYLNIELPEYTLAHNMFVEVAAELGLPALLVFIAVFISTLGMLGRIRKSETAPGLVRETAAALQAGIVGLALAGCFVSAEYQKTTWTGLALAACLLPLARLQARTEAVEQPSSPAEIKSWPVGAPSKQRT